MDELMEWGGDEDTWLNRCTDDVYRSYQSKSVVIKDEHGRSITEQKEILNRWKQYFESLLKNRN